MPKVTSQVLKQQKPSLLGFHALRPTAVSKCEAKMKPMLVVSIHLFSEQSVEFAGNSCLALEMAN